jgi:hypothetical protein
MEAVSTGIIDLGSVKFNLKFQIVKLEFHVIYIYIYAGIQ